MIFNVAGIKFEDERIEFADWPGRKQGWCLLQKHFLSFLTHYLSDRLVTLPGITNFSSSDRLLIPHEV
jgi:hypothetical protein